MCQAKVNGGHRCEVTEQTKALAAAHRRVHRTTMLICETNNPARRGKLEERLVVAHNLLSEARTIPADVLTVVSPLGAVDPEIEEGLESTGMVSYDLIHSVGSSDVNMKEITDVLQEIWHGDIDKLREYDGDEGLVDTLREIGFEDFRISGDIDALDPLASALKEKVSTGLVPLMAGLSDEDLLDEDGLAQVDGLDLEWAMARDERDSVRAEAISLLIARWSGNYSFDSSGSSTGRLDDYQAAAKRLADNGGPVSGGDTKEDRVANIFLGAQYRATQEYFVNKGIESIALYRGFAWGGHDVEDGADIHDAPEWAIPTDNYTDIREVPLFPISSFTLDKETAERFASHNDEAIKGTVIWGTVPVTRILAMPNTGLGCYAEQEVLILGQQGPWNISSNYGDWDAESDS